MKIPAILLFLLLWSIASCNLANRKSEDEGGGQAILARQNDIESSDGSETLADGWHRRDLPKDGISNDCDEAAKGSNVDQEVARHIGGRNQKEGRRQLLGQKAADLIGPSGKRTKTKDSNMEVVPSAIVRGQEFAHDVAEAIGKVVLKHMLRKYMSSVSSESVTHVSNEMRSDMVKNGIDRVGKVTPPPLNNVPLISGEKDVYDGDEDGDGTKTGPKSLKSAVAEIGKLETPPATGGRKEDATKGGTTSELVKPLTPVEAADCGDEAKKGPISPTKSTVDRSSTEGARFESAIEHVENAPAAKRSSRRKRSLDFGQTYGEHGVDPRLRHWQELKTKFTIGRPGVLDDGTSHNDPVTANNAIDWRKFSLDDLLYGDKAREQKPKPNTFRIFNWGEDTSKKGTDPQPWSRNRFSARRYRFDPSGVNDFDTRFVFDNDYTPGRFRTYSWDVGKQGVGRAERQNTEWNFGVSHGENEENRFVSGNKWNWRRLYQPQTRGSDEQQSDIGTTKNKLSNQRSLYQFSIGSGTLEGKDQKNDRMANFNRFQSRTVPNKYRVASLPTIETTTSGTLQGKSQRNKGVVNTKSFQSAASRSKLQITPLPTIGTMTSGVSEMQSQNNAKIANINRFQAATKDQVGAFRMNNQKTERTANANRFDLTTTRNKYQISQLPAIGVYTSERPQMKNQKYVGSANTHRFQSTTPANNYRVPQLATISSNPEKSRNTHNRIRYNHHVGLHDLGFVDVDYFANPKKIDRTEFLRKRHGFQKTQDSSGSIKNAYKVSNFKHNREIPTTAATKIETETNVKAGNRSGKKSAKVTSVAKGNAYDVFLKKGTGGSGTGLYRYNQARNLHRTTVEKVERNDLTGKRLKTWNKQSNGVKSDATTHNGITGRGMHLDRGQSKVKDVSTNTRVSKFGVEIGRSKTNQYSKLWQRPATTKTVTKAVSTKQEKNNVRTKYNFSSKKSKSDQSVQEKTSSESTEFQFIPLVLTPMGTPTRRWSRGRSTIKNKRIYYNPDEVFKMHSQKETAKKTNSQSDDSGRSKSKAKSQPTTSGTTSTAYARWKNNNIKKDRPANKNPSRKSHSSIADASGETYNRFPLILTAVPTSKSYVPIRGVKNKRISTDSAEGMQEDFDNGFGREQAAEEEGEEKIRGSAAKGNYGSSVEISEVINYGKDSRESSPNQPRKFGETSAASGAGSYGQSHVESAELSKSRDVATDKGSRVKDSSGATVEKGTEQKGGNAGEAEDKDKSGSSVDFGTESKGGPASDRGKATYNGIRNGELFEQRQFGQISRPSAVAVASAEVPSADIESSSGSSKGFAGSAAYNGNAAKGSSGGPRRSELRSTSSTASGARDETVERETSGDKLAGLSGRTDSVSAGGMGRAGRIEDASADSMARDGKDEEWDPAKRIFAYRKYMAEEHEGVESRRLAGRQLADKYSGAGAKLHAAGIHGSEKNGKTWMGGAENAANERGSIAGGIEGFGRKATMSGKSRGESSANGKRGQNEFHGGKSAEASAVSGNSNMAIGKNREKTGFVEASAKAAREKMSVEGRMKDSSENEDSASAGAHDELTSHKTKAELDVDKSAKKYLSGDDSRTHGMKEQGSDEKQRSSGINIAGGSTSADASEKFREENNEWLVGESGRGWHRRGALGTHDKGAARAAESALSDKSPAESSAYGKLPSNEIRGKSATEISGVSVKSGASAESGRYTEKLSDASLKDSTRVTNGIRRVNSIAAKEAESVSVANSHGANSMEGVNEFGHGLNEEASLISNQAFAGKKKNMANKVGGVMVESMNNARTKELDLNGALSGSLANVWSQGKNSNHGLTSNKWSPKSYDPFDHESNEEVLLNSKQEVEVKGKNMANKFSDRTVKNANNARSKELNLMGASSGSLANGWSHGKNSKYGLTLNTWSPESSNVFGRESNEKASLMTEHGGEMNEKYTADKVSGVMVESMNNARAKQLDLSGASSGSLTNGWLQSENSKHGLTSNKWPPKSSHAFSAGSNEKASLVSEHGGEMNEKNTADKVSGVMVKKVNNARAKDLDLSGASSGSLTNGWLQSENSKHGLTSNKWSPKSSHAYSRGSNEKASLVSEHGGEMNEKNTADEVSDVMVESMNNARAKELDLSGASSGSLTNGWLQSENSKHGLTSNKWPPKSSHAFSAGSNEKASLVSEHGGEMNEKKTADKVSGVMVKKVNNARARELDLSGASSGSLTNGWLQSENSKHGLTSNKWPPKSSHAFSAGSNEKASLVSEHGGEMNEKNTADEVSDVMVESMNNARTKELDLSGASSGSLTNGWLQSENSKHGLTSNKWPPKSSHAFSAGSNEKASLISEHGFEMNEKNTADEVSDVMVESMNNARAKELDLSGASSGSLTNGWLQSENSKHGLTSNKWPPKSSHAFSAGSNEKASFVSEHGGEMNEKNTADKVSGVTVKKVNNARARELDLSGASSGSLANRWSQGENSNHGLTSNKWSPKSSHAFSAGSNEKASLVSEHGGEMNEKNTADKVSGVMVKKVNNARAKELDLSDASSGSLTNDWLQSENSKPGLTSNKWSPKSSHAYSRGSNEKASLVSEHGAEMNEKNTADKVSGVMVKKVNNARAKELDLSDASSGSLTNDWLQSENSKHGLTSNKWSPKSSHAFSGGSNKKASLISEHGFEMNEKNTADEVSDVMVESMNNARAKELDLSGASSGSLANGWSQTKNSKHGLTAISSHKVDHGASEATQKHLVDKYGGIMVDSANNARDKKSNLLGASSRLVENGWSKGENSKHGLSSHTWPPKSSHAFGSADASADVESDSVNIEGLGTVKGSNSYDKSSSDSLTNNWEYGKSRGNGLHLNHLPATSLRTFGAARSNAGAESKSDIHSIQRLNLAHGKELRASSDSSVFANTQALSDTTIFAPPPNKLPSSLTFGRTKTDDRAASEGRDKNSIMDLFKSPTQSSTFASLQNRMQSDQSDHGLLTSSGANAGTAAGEKSESNESSEARNLSIKGSTEQSFPMAKSGTETLSGTDSEESHGKYSNMLSGESDEHLEHNLGRENDLSSTEHTNWQIPKKSSTFVNAKADVEIISTDSPKSDIEIIAPNKGTSKSSASHESVVRFKGDNEIHDTNLATKQPSASSSSAANSPTYAKGKSSGDRYKWKSGASKIPPPAAATSHDSAVEAETSASTGSQAKSFAHRQLIGNNFSLEKSGINKGLPPPKFVKHVASNSAGKSSKATGKNYDNRPDSSPGSAIELISLSNRAWGRSSAMSDGGWGLTASISSGRSFAELPEASKSSMASAGTQGRAAADTYSITATEFGASSELPAQVGTHGTDKQGSDPKSSPSAFASSSGSRTNSAKLEDRELSDDLSAASVASGEGLAGWPSAGFRNGEAPQAKQSPLSAKSHAEESSERVDKLSEFNSKKLTDEFTAVSPGSSSSGPTEKVAAGAERSTAKSFAAQKVADEDRGRNVLSDKAESMSSAESDEDGTKHGLEGRHLGRGHGEKLFRVHHMATGNTGGKIGMTGYLDVLKKGTGGSGLTKSSNLGYEASESEESKIRRVPGKYTESDLVWAYGNGGAKNVRRFKYGSGNEGKGSLFMKGMSEAKSQAKINGHDGRIKLRGVTADASSASGSIKSLERMKLMNEESKKVDLTNSEADEYKIWGKTDSKAEASANAVHANVIENMKQILAESDLNEQNFNAKSSAAEKHKLTQIQNLLPEISEFRNKNKAETKVGASWSSSAESSTTAADQDEIKEDVEEDVSLNESQAKAAAHGSVGNDKLSGKKFAGKLIDASSQVAAGAGSQHHEFDGKDASSVVSDTERTEGIAGTKSMSSAGGDSSREESGDKEGSENKSAGRLFHSKVIDDLRDKSASKAVSGKLISADSKAASVDPAWRKKWSLTESDTVSSEIRRLAKMRNKLAASEEDLSSLSIVKNEGADAELINGKWSAASGGVLTKSRVDAVGVGKSSISSEAGESSESDSGALLRSMGGDKLREREEIDELADGTATSAASGKANSKIASGHVGQRGSGSSRQTSISKSGASAESEASEALDMLTSAESSAGLDESHAKSSARLVGPKSSFESQADKKAESGKKEVISSSRDQSAKLLRPPPNRHDKSQKLTLKSIDESNSVKSGEAEASRDKIILHNEPGKTTIRAKLSEASAKASAENYGGANDVGGKLDGKWTVGSASFGKSAARDGSSAGSKSWSHAAQDAFNMQASSESADSLARDALSSGGAINGKRRFDGSAEASSKWSAAVRGQELSAGTGWGIGHAGGGSVSASAASSAKGVESSGELRMRDNADAGKELRMKGMNSEGKNKNAGGEWGEYELGGWAEWVKANQWKENQQWWRKNLVSSSGERGKGVGAGKSDEQTNEGLMFISYDSLGRATVQGKNVNKGGQVGGSGGSDDESFVNLAEWTNGDFDRKKVRMGEISGLLPHESSDGSGHKEKSPHAAVIVPLTSAEWWSKQDGVKKNAGRDGKPSLFKFLGRQEKKSPEGKDESEGNDEFMTAEVVADSTDRKPDSKDLEKGKRIELIPVTSTDSDHNSERKDDATGSSEVESKDNHTDKKKKCIKLYTVPADNTPGSKERVKQFIKGVSYEFEPNSSSPEENSDKNSGITDQIKKNKNPKKPFKICLNLDSSDTTNYQVMDKSRTEIFVVKWTSEGPVKVAKIEDKAKPAVIYKLLSRHIYEKIRNLLAHK